MERPIVNLLEAARYAVTATQVVGPIQQRQAPSSHVIEAGDLLGSTITTGLIGLSLESWNDTLPLVLRTVARAVLEKSTLGYPQIPFQVNAEMLGWGDDVPVKLLPLVDERAYAPRVGVYSGPTWSDPIDGAKVSYAVQRLLQVPTGDSELLATVQGVISLPKPLPAGTPLSLEIDLPLALPGPSTAGVAANYMLTAAIFMLAQATLYDFSGVKVATTQTRAVQTRDAIGGSPAPAGSKPAWRYRDRTHGRLRSKIGGVLSRIRRGRSLGALTETSSIDAGTPELSLEWT